VRSVLPSIHVPALIIQRSGDRIVRRGLGRYLAESIPNARYVEQEGDAHILWLGDLDELLGEVEEFLTGARTSSDVDRVLATVLFTDIVGSTKKATELGDRRWRQRLDEYDTLVQRQLERFRGRQVNTTGDGTLAAFDGPGRAVRCASAIEEAVQGLDLQIRAGVHSGEVELRGEGMTGIAIHSRPEYRPWRVRWKFWSPRLSRTWWPDPASSSRTAATTNSRAYLGIGDSLPSASGRRLRTGPESMCEAPGRGAWHPPGLDRRRRRPRRRQRTVERPTEADGALVVRDRRGHVASGGGAHYRGRAWPAAGAATAYQGPLGRDALPSVRLAHGASGEPDLRVAPVLGRVR
jgi:hypothetical protein